MENPKESLRVPIKNPKITGAMATLRAVRRLLRNWNAAMPGGRFYGLLKARDPRGAGNNQSRRFFFENLKESLMKLRMLVRILQIQRIPKKGAGWNHVTYKPPGPLFFIGLKLQDLHKLPSILGVLKFSRIHVTGGGAWR